MAQASGAGAARSELGARWEPEEVWVEDGPVEEPGAPPRPVREHRPAAPAWRDVAIGRDGGASPGGHRHSVPHAVLGELSSAAGAARGSRLGARLADASYAYERERYEEARRVLRPLTHEVPGVAAVRELYGLVLYRMGRWAEAATQLDAYRQLTGSCDLHPVIADCYRALRRYDGAATLWEELRRASPNGDVVAEGRIVAAGCRADRGDLAGAIGLLERAARRVNHPQERHLRQWYALADLYERAGDVPRARDLFNRVAGADPGTFDVRLRLRALR